HVSKILVVDAAGGADYVQIDQGVLADADITAGDGDDTLIYMGSGRAVLNGGAGNDTIIVGSGHDNALNGGPGNDRLTGGTANDTLNGGTGDDVLHGGGGNDIVVGGPGADSVLGDGADDTITWQIGDGNDSVVDGGTGTNDRLRVILSNAADTLSFSSGVGNGFTATLPGAVLSGVNIEGSDVEAMGGS